MNTLFYKPAQGVAADFIPFYWEGKFHLFYLKDFRDPEHHGEGTPWFHLVTSDFVTFEESGEALPRGKQTDQDLYVFTGSVLVENRNIDDPIFHIFYTGHNPHYQEQRKPIQAVMHAFSRDLFSWTKDPDFVFFAPEDLGYEADDWRDPFVFWNENSSEYWMLLAARKNQGPSRNRGLTALAVSNDLKKWHVRQPFWDPNLYYTHECPDLFKMGDWWYLVYSTFSERCVTHYRMSRSISGPWLTPSNDTFDGRGFYAAKTVSDDVRRWIVGWLPTRTDQKDDGEWNWGGNLVVHEIQQEIDGTLSVRPPETVRQAFPVFIPSQSNLVLGEWNVENWTYSCDSESRLSIVNLGELPDPCRLEMKVLLQPGTASAGLLIKADNELNTYYQLRIEPASKRILIDRWPRPGDQPFMLERPLPYSSSETYIMTILIENSCLVVYINDKLALSCRLYDHPKGNLCLFVSEGKGFFQILN